MHVHYIFCKISSILNERFMLYDCDFKACFIHYSKGATNLQKTFKLLLNHNIKFCTYLSNVSKLLMTSLM